MHLNLVRTFKFAKGYTSLHNLKYYSNNQIDTVCRALIFFRRLYIALHRIYVDAQ